MPWISRGNPSSVHAEGRQARRLVEDARAAVAAAVGAEPQNVIFTSGGTEANALALAPGLQRGKGAPVHAAARARRSNMLRCLPGGRFAAEAIRTIGVTRSGVVDLDHLRTSSLAGRRRWCRSCWPTTRPARSSRSREAAEIVHAAGGLLHVDAIQAFGKIPFDLASTGADLLTLSAHKIGGPKGVGAVVLAEGC